jgi:hypothetical protein
MNRDRDLGEKFFSQKTALAISNSEGDVPVKSNQILTLQFL